MAWKQPQHVDATFYAVVIPKWSTYAKDEQDRPVLSGAKVDKITQVRPRVLPKAGGVVTRLTLRIDAAALLPLQPEAVIHVRAGDVELIEVTAEDPAKAVDDA